MLALPVRFIFVIYNYEYVIYKFSGDEFFEVLGPFSGLC